MGDLHVISSRRLRPDGKEARSTIISVIRSFPGIRYRELARKTSMTNGKLSYHINMLERQKVIVVFRDRGSTRYFPEGYDEIMCKVIASASHSTTLSIVALLLRKECSYFQIKQVVMRSGSTICEHLKKLRSAGLLSRRRIDRVWVYSITDADKVFMILNRRYAECQVTN